MATIPVPRSYNQMLGDATDAFLSRCGIPALKVGGPPLAFMEAFTQSDVRVSQDIFQMLAADSLDRAEGTALDRIGADEEVPRITESPSSGVVTVTDPAFQKISSKIFAGQAAPIAGSDKVYVLNATTFPATGNIYLGRGTTNYEGPLQYTAKTNLGTYWRLDLHSSTKTTKFHNHNETVVLAQGGNRLISAGAIAQTPQGNVSQAVQFRVLYTAQIPDGEISVDQVQVIAQKPGVSGNIPAGNINSFTAPPFANAQVTNPLPYTNAKPRESDKDYRERIRNVRKSRAKGTDLAISSSVLGITSADEPKRVVSSVVVKRLGLPTTLIIDDGTGYEERSDGIAQEILVDSSFGGEDTFQVAADRPVTKAFVLTSISAPYTLSSGMVLAVKVSGVLSKHTFNASEFKSISNASGYEVVASINGNPALSWSARTLASGTLVAIFAKSEENEDIEVVSADDDEVDANPVMGFSIGRADTMRLYKNDLLLSKDGQRAIVESNAQVTWAAMSGSQTLDLQVDDTPSVTYTFTDLDFVNAATGYATLSASNSLAAWAAVFNQKLPGITTTAGGGKLTLVSNKGTHAKAAIKITGGTLVSGGKLFTFNTATGLVATGKARDYTLNRNTGQLALASVLEEGDRLSIGTANTRAFVESADIVPISLASTGELWFVVDGSAQIIPSGLVSSSVVGFSFYDTTPPMTWGDRVRVACASAVFQNVQVGDWAIHLDSNLNAANKGAWRVAYVDPAFFYYEFERTTATVQLGVTLNGGGIVFVRTPAQLQKITIPAATNYTAATFVDEINADIIGAQATVYQTNRIRVRTNSFDTNGDIALVAQNGEGSKLGMTPASATENLTSHLASVQSGTPEDGTPWFTQTTVNTITTPQTVFTPTDTSVLNQQSILKFLRNLPDADSGVPRSRFGTNKWMQTPITINGGTNAVTTRKAALNEYVNSDRLYGASCWALGQADELTVLIDGDLEQKRYVIPMFRRLKPTSNTYGATNTFTDMDNGNQSLAVGFGTGFDFKDFIAYMKARIKSHSEAGDTNKSVLWRYFRYGADGLLARVRYTYPTAPDAVVAVSSDSAPIGNEGNIIISVALPSSSARSGQTIRNTTRIGTMAATSGSLQILTYILGFPISSALRNVQLNYTARNATAFTGVVTGGTSGATGTVVSDSLAGGGTGAGTLILSGVTGTFANGETITAGAASATSSGGQIGLTTLTLNVAASGATDHGFAVNDQIWTQSTSGSFATGLYTISAKTATTVTYQENTNSVGATANIGTVSFDSAGEATLTGSNIVADDIMNLGPASSLANGYERSVRISSLGAQFWKGPAETALSTGTVPTWAALNDAAALVFFPINSGSATAAAIATSVNALAAAVNTLCPVTAVAVGVGGDTSGVISRASFDDFSAAGYSYTLKDGLNWVSSHTTPPDTSTNFDFTFKAAVQASLATNSDWVNEEIHLVPMSAKNMVDYLNTLAVSGLSSVAEAARATEARYIQISSRTLGSEGSVQVQGGTANSLSASVLGSAVNLISTYSMATVKKADVEGLSKAMWVEVQNTAPMPKEVFTSGTGASAIDTLGNFTLTTTPAWTYANASAAQLNATRWQIEQQGKFTAFVWDGISTSPALGGIEEGDWVVISKGAKTISSRNCGQFRVVRCSDTLKTFWIENPNMAEEFVTADLWFLTYDSIMPGDTLSIGSDVWGAGNQGLWTVESINSGNTFQFKVSVANKPTATFGGPGVLGSQAALVQLIEGEPTKLVKQVRSISLNSVDGSLCDVKFETDDGYKKIGAVAGSTIIALDKLAFPGTIAEGIDGYRHSLGLIAEANRILYGVDDDPATYPGIVASGSNVNQSGPLVKRISIAVAIRTRATGVVVDEVKKRVRSAIASVVNGTKTGSPISLADIVAAVKSVNGVIGVVIISPAYGVGNDLIPVQPYEKPLILNLDQDIQVSLVGD